MSQKRKCLPLSPPQGQKQLSFISVLESGVGYSPSSEKADRRLINPAEIERGRGVDKCKNITADLQLHSPLTRATQCVWLREGNKTPFYSRAAAPKHSCSLLQEDRNLRKPHKAADSLSFTWTSSQSMNTKAKYDQNKQNDLNKPKLRKDRDR